MRWRRPATLAALVAVVGVGLSACGASDNGGTIPVPSTSTTAGSGPATTASTIPGGG